MPADSGMAFVLVQHLAPDHRSMLVELLGKSTAMSVTEAEDGMPVAANRVFVIPPDATLTIEDGVLRVSTPAPAREHRRPIDTFFCSLAEDQGESAVCIILSGAGSDGTLGVRTVKEHGGLTLAQAEVDHIAMSGMPRSAADTGLVDHVMPIDEMPARLVEYQRHLIAVGARKGPDGTRQDMADHLAGICALLRSGLGHDFSQYKEKTLVRRAQRRMQVLQIDTVPAYIERLRKEPRERELLFRELLIGVTQFFRDPEAFEALAAGVIPKLLETKSADDQIRVWVPGCATGEEAYSTAILLKEAMARREVAPEVQIFATDINDRAVEIARAGCYRKATIAGLSPERLERWFVDEGDHYRPVKDIRAMCIFSVHSLVKDPPFSRLDLISCRNLLIYLESDLQTRVIRTFHYALRPGGHLLLGSSETVTRQAELFAALDKKHRIFERRDAAAASLPGFPLSSATPDGPPSPAAPQAAADRIDTGARRVMEKYTPAYVVIDRRHEILRFAGETGKYLQPSPGVASLNLFTILQKELRPAAQAALQQAIRSQQRIVHESLAIEIDGKSQFINLIVEAIPAAENEAELYVVAFQDVARLGGDRDSEAPEGTAGTGMAAVQEVERELRTTKAQFQAAIDELERTNEELKSANEEYQSVNEEFQSTNEELETSKEEQQSINEELQTVNAELNSKNEALGRANSDLQNLFESTHIATLFLDGDLRIKSFTPAMTDIFHLRDSDRGRPITEIVARLSYDDLKRDVTKVLRTLSAIEQEVRIPHDGATFIMRVRPYRTLDNVIDGVVITFVDITERKRHEADRARLAAIVESSQDAIIGHALDGRITSWNAGAEAIFGYTAAEAVGQPLAILLPEHQSDEMPRILETLKRGERVEPFEIGRARKGGARIDASLTISPVRDASGAVIAASTIARDVSERRQATDHKNLLIAELDHRVKNTLAIITSLIAQTLRTAGSPEAFATLIENRVQALSRAHSLLTRSGRSMAPLRDIVLGELTPYCGPNPGKNIVIDGDDGVLLAPKATLALAMALHELATNAAKYGALSASEGQVAVTWSVADASDPQVTLDWIETGGPPVTPPTRRGFGSDLIERMLPHELAATVTRDFPAAGVRCRIAFSLTDKVGQVRTDRRKRT
jgi:two-component system, chemotaxis family, CheB/CheR fusion protein